MQQTEKYLNGILSKRMGSVINQSNFNNNVNTVTRLPRQEETVDSMPTVFRKKHQTVLIQEETRSKQIRQSMRSQIIDKSPESGDQKPVGSHRVEYMAISKRIVSKKTQDFISPTVDITKYQKKQLTKISKSPNRFSKVEAILEQPQQGQGRPSFDIGSAKAKRRKIFS